MCDYSIENCKSRDARVGDRLVSGRIRTTDGSWTRSKGFYAKGDDSTAICLRPGTELAFEGVWWWLAAVKESSNFSTAIFREVNVDNAIAHHDALESPDGRIIKVAWLTPGQTAVVLQLPATQIQKQAHAEEGLTVRLPDPSPADA